MDGPMRQLTGSSSAAAQLHQTSHSCIVQHFVGSIVGRRTLLPFIASD